MNNSKEHILRTAFRLFLQKSFKEVTMRDIVKETGLSKGAFYHYFNSKEQLFIEVIDTFYLGKMIIDYDKLNHNSLQEFYRDYVFYIKNAVKELKNILLLSDSNININYITIMFDAMKLFPGFQSKVRKAQKQELKAWMQIVNSARKKGEFSSPMTDEQIALMFIYSNDGIALRLLLEGNLNKAFSEMLNLWNNFYKEILDEK